MLIIEKWIINLENKGLIKMPKIEKWMINLENKEMGIWWCRKLNEYSHKFHYINCSFRFCDLTRFMFCGFISRLKLNSVVRKSFQTNPLMHFFLYSFRFCDVDKVHFVWIISRLKLNNVIKKSFETISLMHFFFKWKKYIQFFLQKP